MCETVVVFADCERCTGPISTNPESLEACEHGLTRGKRFIARCLKLVAVTGLMWVSWCVFGGAGFFRVFFSRIVFFFERTRPAVSTRPPFILYLATSIIGLSSS